MPNILACRAARPQHLAAIREAGLKHVEIGLPPRDQLPEVRAQLEAQRLTASSVSVRLDVKSDEGIAHVEDAFKAVRELGARIVFTSVRADEADRDGVYHRLRRVGDIAAQYGLTVALETHPDLVTNGALGRATMEAVAHPHIRINFDTANVYYYNEGTNAVAELERVLPYVAAVHLKDTMGGYRSGEFPPVGQGVVDFPAVFRLLAQHGYAGPFTLEIEGDVLQRGNPATAFADFLQASVKYLAGLGLR